MKKHVDSIANHVSPALPNYTIGVNAYDNLGALIYLHGKKVLIIGGLNALNAGLKYVEEALQGSGIKLLVEIYTGEPTRFQAKKLADEARKSGADIILGIGGGRAIDAAKAAGYYAYLPVFTLPTIPATCAAITALSVMYDDEREPFLFLRQSPEHVFIHTGILAASPPEYLRAGIGDSIAKHVESAYKAGDYTGLDYEDLLGLYIATMGYDTLLSIGEKAIEAAKESKDNSEYRLACECCIVNTGIVSILLKEALNGALAHSLYYALKHENGISNYLHGEIVAWGSIVQLVMEGSSGKAIELMDFLNNLNIPISLANMGSSIEAIKPKLKEVLNQPDMLGTPVSEYALQHAIEKTEWLSMRKAGK